MTQEQFTKQMGDCIKSRKQCSMLMDIGMGDQGKEMCNSGSWKASYIGFSESCVVIEAKGMRTG